MNKALILIAALCFTLVAPSAIYGYGDETTRKEMKSAFEEKSYNKLFDLVSPFAENGDVKAQFHLCTLHWHGLGTRESTDSAILWCKKASGENSHAEDYLELLKLIAAQVGSPTLNKSAALGKLSKQAEGGDRNAQWLMYRIHDEGLFTFNKKDKESRQLWLNKAVSNDHPQALIEVARKSLTSEDKKAQEKFVSYMELAASQNEPKAMYLLGIFYKPWGVSGEEEKPHRNYEKATYWFRKAAKIDGSGAIELAELLRGRKNPVRDDDEAVKWLNLAANDGDQGAQVLLASLYENGEVVRRDLKAALKWYQKATGHKIYNFNFANYSTAAYKVARFYLDGIGVDTNSIKAAEILHKISDNNNADKSSFRNRFTGLARYYLGLMYEKGIGVKKDRRKAFNLYQQATEQDEVLAARRLNFLKAFRSELNKKTVTTIQDRLQKLGYKVSGADGVFGEKTFDALRAFQCAVGTEITGIPAHDLLKKIQAEHKSKMRKFSADIWNEKLFEAIHNTDIDCVTAALVNGANPNALKNTSNPLGMLTYVRPKEHYDDYDLQQLKVQIADRLIKYGAKPNTYNSGLFFAISNGNVGFLRLLLNSGISPIAKIDGKRLIEWAAYYDQPSIENLLIEYGATRLSKRKKAQERLVNSPSIFGGGVLKAKDALADGAGINRPATDGATVLISAVRNGIYNLGALNFLKFLLENGVNPNRKANGNFRDLEGIPLHIFVFMNSHSMNGTVKDQEGRGKSQEYAISAMALLLKHGAKVAVRDGKGRTPLHWAAKNNNIAAAIMLLKAGATTTHRDSKGALPLDYAESAEMISLLKGSRIGKAKKKNAKTSGSGFVVSRAGHIVTNAHVVNGCEEIKIGKGDAVSFSAKIVSMDTRNDLALIKPEKAFDSEISFNDVAVLRNRDVGLGESVVVSGFPYGKLVSNSVKITSGIVSATKGFENNSGQFQIDAAVQPGNSGGPIFDKSGKVIGVVVAQLSKLKMAQAVGSLPENSNFGIKVSALNAFLESANIDASTGAGGKARSLEDVAQIAKLSTLMVNCLQE
jgi:TPR repeat protein/S1-C subfamily serine protease